MLRLLSNKTVQLCMYTFIVRNIMTRNEEINQKRQQSCQLILIHAMLKREEMGKEYFSRSSSHLIICIHSSLTKQEVFSKY